MSGQSHGDGWWEASDGKWYPPEPDPSQPLSPHPSVAPHGNRAVGFSLWAGGAGWVILGFFAALTAFTGEGTNCTANRGDRYQSCVRNGDLTGLIAQAAVVGLAAMAVVVMLRGWGRQREAVLADSRLWVATAVLAGLLVVSGLSWIWGIQGGWAPSRPFPYEPVTTTQANTIMVAGLLVGLLVGALVPLERDHR